MDLSYAQWTRTTTDPGTPGNITRTTHWLRISPPAQAWKNEYQIGWSYNVIDERGRLHTNSQRDDCLLYPDAPRPTAEDLLRMVLASEPPPVPVFEETIDPLTVRPVFRGLRRVLLYEWETVRHNLRTRYKMWADRKSLRLIRKEKQEFNLLSGQPFSHEVCDRYIYNRKPPEGTFDMPLGRPIVPAIPREEITGEMGEEMWDGYGE